MQLNFYKGIPPLLPESGAGTAPWSWHRIYYETPTSWGCRKTRKGPLLHFLRTPAARPRTFRTGTRTALLRTRLRLGGSSLLDRRGDGIQTQSAREDRPAPRAFSRIRARGQPEQGGFYLPSSEPPRQRAQAAHFRRGCPGAAPGVAEEGRS